MHDKYFWNEEVNEKVMPSKPQIFDLTLICFKNSMTTPHSVTVKCHMVWLKSDWHWNQ